MYDTEEIYLFERIYMKQNTLKRHLIAIILLQYIELHYLEKRNSLNFPFNKNKIIIFLKTNWVFQDMQNANNF